jgi:hypothetical protein
MGLWRLSSSTLLSYKWQNWGSMILKKWLMEKYLLSHTHPSTLPAGDFSASEVTDNIIQWQIACQRHTKFCLEFKLSSFFYASDLLPYSWCICFLGFPWACCCNILHSSLLKKLNKIFSLCLLYIYMRGMILSFENCFLIVRTSQAMVAHFCNPSYSRGRDQKDCTSKIVQANSSWGLILKKPFTKKGWWSGSRCSLSSNSSTTKKFMRISLKQVSW